MTDYVAGDRPIGEVPFTTEATNGQAVAHVVGRRLGRPTAWWGIMILIASEATLFTALFGTYYYLRFNTPTWPPDGIPEPKALVPLILVSCLAVTSVPMQLASLAARAGRLAATRVFLLVALFVQCGYFAYEMHDFRDQVDKLAVTRDAYTSIYYVLLGGDHAHVFIGLLFNVWLLLKLARGLTTYRVNAVQAIAWYWHFVNIMTFLVIGALLSARV